jgi:hypothetical protein
MAHHDVDVVIAMQMSAAVCTNPKGDNAVRQEGPSYRKEDTWGAWIGITPNNTKRLADAIMALAEPGTASGPLALLASEDRMGADQQRRYRARQRNGHTATPSVMVADHEGNGATDLFEGARAD